MKRYELVCVLDTSLSSADVKEKKQKIESIITTQQGSILDTDDMGLMPLAHPLNGQMQAYIISYCLEIDPSELGEIKSQYAIEKGLAKYFFYSLREGETFLKFADLQKRYEDMYAEDEVEEDDVEEDSTETPAKADTPTDA